MPIRNPLKRANNQKSPSRKKGGVGKKATVCDLNSSDDGPPPAIVSLREFLAAVPDVPLMERKLVVEQALLLFQANYVHLPMKRAMHAVDPVQRLKLVQQRLERIRAEDIGPALDFQREITEIFLSVRDRHTNYYLPAPFDKATAFLPFMVEECYGDGAREYLATHFADFQHPTFVSGVRILCWNGVPIERAVAANAARDMGCNEAARHDRGVVTLTTRALLRTLPPDEEWVVIGYQDLNGNFAEVRIEWKVSMPQPELPAPSVRNLHSSVLGLDGELDAIQQFRKCQFAPAVVARERRIRAEGPKALADSGDLASIIPDVLEARRVETPDGQFGYIRIRTFMVFKTDVETDTAAFIAEVIRLMELLPQNGLIIDVRGNGGGVVYAGERLLQLFTPRRIQPELVQFINTPLNLRLCRRHGPGDPEEDLSPWVPSMELAVETGSIYSAAFPMTSPESCNSTGQRYHGPVLIITDGLCYSTTDFFAAGFQDHQIGPVLGVSANTGAGGANVWTLDFLESCFRTPEPPDPQSPYKLLGNGANMRIALRRGLRNDLLAGMPVEELGVVPDERHFMTRNDLLVQNVDLVNKAGSILSKLPMRRIAIEEVASSGSRWKIKVATAGFSRLDVLLNCRPVCSLDIAGEETSFSVEKGSEASADLELQGFLDAKLVAARRIKGRVATSNGADINACVADKWLFKEK